MQGRRNVDIQICNTKNVKILGIIAEISNTLYTVLCLKTLNTQENWKRSRENLP
jgi:hypothetical protein